MAQNKKKAPKKIKFLFLAEFKSLFIFLSSNFWYFNLFVFDDSWTNISPIFIKIISALKTIKVVCQ